MLIVDNKTIGNRLRDIRKRRGISQAVAAELSELSDRTYADIERGNTSMSLHSLLSICLALNITPDDILVDDTVAIDYTMDHLFEELRQCPPSEKVRIAKVLATFLNKPR